jgi:hypothetical protein
VRHAEFAERCRIDLTGVTLRSTVAFSPIGALGNGPITRSRMPCVWPRSAATANVNMPTDAFLD